MSKPMEISGELRSPNVWFLKPVEPDMCPSSWVVPGYEIPSEASIRSAKRRVMGGKVMLTS